MSYCVNSQCQYPQNTKTDQYCLNCGSPVLLKERYRPLRKIGQGGFGRTFLAQDEHIPSQPACVIKQLHLQPFSTDIETRDKAKSLFQQEAVRLDQLGQHAQIPKLLAHFEQDGHLYLVQELIEGQTLTEELNEQDFYTEEQIWQLLRDLVPVLQFIHQRRVIHRDIKPSNIMRRTSDRLPILIDFGVAKLLSRTQVERTGTIIGSAEYIAPEQLRGKATPASDLFSLGVTCIHLLTHLSSPLEMYNIADERWEWRDYLLPENRVSDRLGRILDKLLQNRISQRFQSADEVLEVLATPGSSIVLQTPAIAKLTKKTPKEPAPTLTNPIAYAKSFLHRSAPEAEWLVSECGVNYTHLRNCLAAKRWKAADEETWVVLCQALGKAPRSYLLGADIEKLPCEDLQILDLLWMKYSDRQFGFSVQRQIYLEVGGDYSSFCDRVGWPVHNEHRSAKGLQYNLRSPVGHLPSRIWVGGTQWWRHANAMLVQLENCGIT